MINDICNLSRLKRALSMVLKIMDNIVASHIAASSENSCKPFHGARCCTLLVVGHVQRSISGSAWAIVICRILYFLKRENTPLMSIYDIILVGYFDLTSDALLLALPVVRKGFHISSVI